MRSSHRIPVLLLLFASAAGIEALRLSSLSSLGNRDLWWHLSTGLWIFQNHALPHNGIFSQSSDLPWAASSWAYDFLAAGCYRVLDLRSIPFMLMIFKIALALVTFLLAAGLGGRDILVRGNNYEKAGARFWGAIFLSVIAQYILGAVPLGPGYISVILFAVELLLLVEVRGTGNWRSLYWLPPLFFVWANLDVQFVYGIGLLLLFVAAHYVQDRRRHSGTSEIGALTPKAIVGAVALSLLATLLTPYFYQPWAIFFATAASPANRYFGDFRAMSFHQPQDYLLLLLTMSAFLALGRRRSRDLFLIGVLIGCAAVSFHAQRDAWLVTIAALAVISSQYPVAGSQTLSENVESKPQFPPDMFSSRRWILGTGYWVLALALLALGAVLLIPRDVMLVKLAEAYPVAAANAVRAQQLPQPIFNSYEFGGFLTWYLQEYPVAIDGRADLYGPDSMIQYSKAMNADIPYTAYPAMNQARTLLLSRSSIMGDALAGLPAFKVVYRDNVAIVLEKESSQFPVLSSQSSVETPKDGKASQ